LLVFFAAIVLGILSSFQLGAASLTNQSKTTTATSLPIADILFYIEHITVTGQNPINATHVEVSLSGNGNLT